MKRILIIDNEEKIRRVYRNALVEEGFEVLEAETVWLGVIEIFRASDIDLVLWGINPHRISEDHLLRIAKEHDLRIKVIVSSVCSLNQQRGLIPGANDYFDKMESVDVLIQKVNHILQ